MKMRIFIVCLICFWEANLIGSPWDDLRSPSQETRDAAANTIRSSHLMPPSRDWVTIVDTITNGMTKTNVSELLSTFNVTLRQAGGSSWVIGTSFFCILDDTWFLSFYFEPTNHTLSSKIMGMVEDWVEPPTNYTGIWITYYVNGQMSRKIQFADGKQQGEFMTFRSDGSKDNVQHFEHGLAEGVCVGYYPSGHTNSSAIYEEGWLVSTVVYNEDGTVKETAHWSRPPYPLH